MTSGELRLLEETDVSRETLDRLKLYATLLEKWNSRINLVSKATIPDLWSRHFVDSAQLAAIPDFISGRWTDLGSGGGFPGAVIAIIMSERSPAASVQMIESDRRKAEFLRAVARETGIQMKITCDRIEDATPARANVVSARALAPLDTLLGYATRHLRPGGIALFPKGEKVDLEVSDALENWNFHCEKYPSKTDANSVILKIEDIRRA